MEINDMKSVTDDFEKVLLDISKIVADSLGSALQTLGKDTIEQCPLDTGELRESMLVTVNGSSIYNGTQGGVSGSGNIKPGDKYDASVSYDTSYAVIQHEDKTLNHPTPGTKAKFLEDPFKSNAKNIKDTIAKNLKKGLK